MAAEKNGNLGVNIMRLIGNVGSTKFIKKNVLNRPDGDLHLLTTTFITQLPYAGGVRDVWHTVVFVGDVAKRIFDEVKQGRRMYVEGYFRNRKAVDETTGITRFFSETVVRGIEGGKVRFLEGAGLGLNSHTLLGNIGREDNIEYEADIKEDGESCSQLKFSLCANIPMQNGDGSTWHTVVVKGKLADSIHEYIVEGRQVFVQGTYVNRIETDEDGRKHYYPETVVEAAGDIIRLLGGTEKKDSEEKSEPVDEKALLEMAEGGDLAEPGEKGTVTGVPEEAQNIDVSTFGRSAIPEAEETDGKKKRKSKSEKVAEEAPV